MIDLILITLLGPIVAFAALELALRHVLRRRAPTRSQISDVPQTTLGPRSAREREPERRAA